MLLAVSGGEAHPTLLPAHWTRSLSFTKTADEDVKKRRGEKMFIYCPSSIRCYNGILFNPFWGQQGVNSPLWVELIFLTLSLRKHRNDIKEIITTAAQNLPKLTKPPPPSFQKAAVIQSTTTSGFATKSSPRKIMKWAGYVSLHNVLDHGLCRVIYELDCSDSHKSCSNRCNLSTTDWPNNSHRHSSVNTT